MNRFHWTTIIAVVLLSLVTIFSPPHRNMMALTLVVLYFAVFAAGLSIVRLSFFCRAVCRIRNAGRRIALTFDDGPDPATTPAVLDVLDRNKCHAAFFCIGEKVLRHPELAMRIVNGGHIIANHTMRHSWRTNFLASKALSMEMAAAQNAVRGVTGNTPALFRPPAGLTNPHIGKALRSNHLTCIGWDVRPFDTKKGQKDVVRTVVGKTRAGSIILLHDTGRHALEMREMLQNIIDGLRAKGFEIVPLDGLAGIEAYLDDDTASTPVAAHPGLARWLLHKPSIQKALADNVSIADMRQRPSLRFVSGMSLVAFSYVIGWPAVAFFAFLAVYLGVKEIVLLGPASYVFSHFVFLAGAGIAGVDLVRYSRLFLRYIMHRLARWLHAKASIEKKRQ